MAELADWPTVPLKAAIQNGFCSDGPKQTRSWTQDMVTVLAQTPDSHRYYWATIQAIQVIAGMPGCLIS